MSINIGNTKIGKVFIGSTEIAKIYQGNILLFENDKSIPAYAYTKDSKVTYLLGSNSTSGFISIDGGIDTDELPTLTNISGTLGTSGSKIRCNNVAVDCLYNSTKTYSGVKIYVYKNDSDFVDTYIFVIEDSIVGSKCAWCATANSYSPTSVTSNSMTYNSRTFTRASSYDKKFTRKGFK